MAQSDGQDLYTIDELTKWQQAHTENARSGHARSRHHRRTSHHEAYASSPAQSAPSVSTAHRTKRWIFLRVLAGLLCLLLTGTTALASVLAVLHFKGKQQVEPVLRGVAETPYAVTYNEGKIVEYKNQKYALNENIVTLLLLGVDQERLGLENGQIGTAGQADLILVAALDLKKGTVSLVMVPRDSMADVNLYAVDGTPIGVKRLQICLSFAYGDGKLGSCRNVATSVERLLYEIPVRLYGVLDMNGIPALNDAVGGVDVTVPDSFQTSVRTFQKGESVHLTGETAKAYVRGRNKKELRSDTVRRTRQIQYIRAFWNKAVHAIQRNPKTISTLYSTAMRYADTNISLSKATYFITTLLAKGVRVEDIRTLNGEMVPAEPFPEYILDEASVFETVLDVFFEPAEEN